IENLVAVVAAEQPDGAERDLLAFDTLTLVPYDRALIDPALLDDGERAWIDGYHARVRSELSPLLDEAARNWLQRATAPLPGGVIPSPSERAG
ncbi:MAG TPA: M24 family metallopeptidase C-terminal domain-containing protein, partial [Magnetospirillum sp.]|nr:M24 family metallopeptidase C-terminal domain-containing protein [Magnetospirillum sp.]